MSIRNKLTHLGKPFQIYGKKVSNILKLYPESSYQVPFKCFTDSFYRYKIPQQFTTKNYFPFSINDSSWVIIKTYRIAYPRHIKNQFQTTMIKWQHDSEFNLESFKKGTKQVRTVQKMT